MNLLSYNVLLSFLYLTYGYNVILLYCPKNAKLHMFLKGVCSAGVSTHWDGDELHPLSNSINHQGI